MPHEARATWRDGVDVRSTRDALIRALRDGCRLRRLGADAKPAVELRGEIERARQPQ
jgi:hypothetical protein